MSQKATDNAASPKAGGRGGGRARGRRGENGGASFERHIHGYLAGTLGREIVSGVYPAGSLLPGVPEVCERFGVSRTAVREAYSLLTAKALIEARPKVGTRVQPRSEWHLFDPDVLAWHLEAGPGVKFVEDLFVLRQMVEPAAAALAAEHRSIEELERIAEAFARMVQFRNGPDGLIEADLDFHMGILEATRNPFLAALGGLMHASLEGAFRYSWEGAARIKSDRLKQHELILNAIRSGEPELARRRMSELLRDSMSDVRVSPAAET